MTQHVSHEMLMGLKELLADNFELLIRSYLSDGAERIVRLQSALEARDYSAVCMEAHALKGSSNNIGAENFSAICAKVEHQARAQDTMDLEQNVAAVVQLFAAVSEDLQTYL